MLLERKRVHYFNVLLAQCGEGRSHVGEQRVAAEEGEGESVYVFIESERKAQRAARSTQHTAHSTQHTQDVLHERASQTDADNCFILTRSAAHGTSPRSTSRP